MAKFDLSGEWIGEYAYPRNTGPVTPFRATIRDHAGLISGTIIEPNTVDGGAIEADLAGTRGGRGVDFTKTYDCTSAHYANPVDYVGHVSDDGQEITGQWSLLEFDGTFVMRRKAGIKEDISSEAADRVLSPARA